MTRFPQSIVEKGSQKWMQKLVNDVPSLLDLQVREKLGLSEEEGIRWLSPLKDDDYAEYRDQGFIDLLGVKLNKTCLEDFWPRGGPQWDALGKSSSGKLFLVEAKSHIPELISSLQAEDEGSIEKIKTSLEETKRYLNCRANVEWSQCFYQYANRIAHLYLLRKKNDLPAYLIYVYFMNDVEMNGPTDYQEWEGALKLLNSHLGIGKHRLQKFITDVYVDVRSLLGNKS
jgi:hypothetical protein